MGRWGREMSEGALTLPAPQTSRRRADATEVSLSPVVPALGPSYHLGTQHPALLVLRGRERQLGRVGVGSVRGGLGEESCFPGSGARSRPWGGRLSPVTGAGRAVRRRAWQSSSNNFGVTPLLGGEGAEQASPAGPSKPSSPVHTVNIIFKPKARKEESKKQYFSSHAKNGIKRRSGRPRPLQLSLGGPPLPTSVWCWVDGVPGFSPSKIGATPASRQRPFYFLFWLAILNQQGIKRNPDLTSPPTCVILCA